MKKVISILAEFAEVDAGKRNRNADPSTAFSPESGSTGLGMTTRRIATRLAAPTAAILAVWIFALTQTAYAQGSRKDDIVFGPAGHPVAGATIQVCQPTATGTPCAPLATVYTDATLTVAAPNPFQSDGLGNYHFYAPAGRYMIQITGPQITGTITQPDVILPPDVSSTSSGNNISAFGLTLGGNLTVAGNANISGTLTTTTFSPGSFSPSSLSVAGDAQFKGPRPWIDVTSYGALGNATGTFGHDDTVPIQNAINAACASTGVAGAVPIVFLPPGVYYLSQPQTPSTSPVLQLPCSVEIEGAGYYPSGSGFPVMAHGSYLIVQNPGSSPNNAPVFSVQYPSGGIGGNLVLKNLTITGGNQALYVTGSQTVKLYDVCLTNTLSNTDATPLKLTDTFWFYMDGGCLQAGAGQPVALFTAENQGGGAPTSVFDVFIRNILTTGGGFAYDQRTAVMDVGPGGFRFENITEEGANGNGFNILCSNGNAFNFNGLTLDNVTQADNTVGAATLVNLNCTGATLTGLKVLHGYAGNGGNGSAAIATAGQIEGYYADDCFTQCTTGVVDSSGHPTGIGLQQVYSGGWDSTFDTTLTDRLRTDFVSGSIASDSPSNRWFQKGNSFACLGVDPISGWLFADCSHFGFSASLNETSAGTINVNFPQVLPPTNLSGAAASGGSIPAGTYTGVVRTTTDNCTHQSAPSAQSAAITLSGGNGTINWTWTVPTGYVGTNNGYCLTLGSAYSNQYVYVSGASTTSYSMTTVPTGGGVNSLVNTLSPWHVINANGIGIQTTSPGPFNLDVQGPLGARFGTIATPSTSGSYPYTPSCISSVNCSLFIPLSPIMSDTFSRANALTLGANWTLNGGALGISSNAAYGGSTNTGAAFWNGQSFGADQWSQITIGTAPAANDTVIAATVRNAGSGVFTLYDYKCVFTGGAATRVIEKRITGTGTNLASVSAGCSNGDVLRLEVVGSHLAAFYNGALDLTATDTSIATGQPGLEIFTDTSAQPTITNWIGGNLEGSQATDIFNRANFWAQPQSFAAVDTLGNCSSSASPAVCGSAAAGSVTIAAGVTTVVVDTSAVTANSQIVPVFDESLGTKLGVTCNNASASEAAQYFVSARTPGTSFTLKTSVAPTTNPACLSYIVQN